MKQLQKRSILRVATIFVMVCLIITLPGCERSIQTVPFVVETKTPTVPPILLPTSTPELQPTVTSTNTPEATPTAQEQVESSKNSYSFVALLDYNKHVMEVEESIKYTNSTSQEISVLLLIVPPNQTTEGFTLNTVYVESETDVTNYSLEGETLSVLLESPLKNGNTVTIQISYTLKLKSSGGVLGYTSRQTNLSDWYPFVAPYDQENGWIINQPADVGEYLVYDLADFDVTLALTGPQGLLVASSTIAEPVEANIYKMIALNSRNITFSISDQYVQLVKGFSDMVVNAYVFAEDEAAGWAAVENSGRAILLFSTLYGVPYPHGTLSIVEKRFFRRYGIRWFVLS